MNEKLLSILKGTRTGLQILAEPIDSLARFMNYKKGYPPLWIRQKVGNLNDFEGSGGEYMAYLKLLCGLKQGDNVLDIGCGCGLMCLKVNENPTLPEYIYPGWYVGVDINKSLVKWCREHIFGSNIEFTNNPLTDYKENIWDVILCKSLFTHLFKHEVEMYLSLIKRLLHPKGICLATFFLLDDKMPKPKGRYTFENYEGDFSLERYHNPRAAIGYELNWVVDAIGSAGLTFDIHYGSWRGDNKGLSFQDIVIIRK